MAPSYAGILGLIMVVCAVVMFFVLRERYYNTIYYVCGGDAGMGAASNFKMGIAGMVFGFLGISFYTAISKWLGKRHAMGAVLIMAIMAFIGDWWFYNPN